MRLVRTRVLITMGACLLLSGLAPVQSEEPIDWAEVKRDWQSLSPERQRELDAAALAIGEALRDPSKTPGNNCDEATPELGELPLSLGSTTIGRADSLNIGVDCGSGQTPLIGTGIGPDEVTQIVTTEDCELSVVMTPSFNSDLALYVLSPQCTNPNGNCIALDDDGGPGTVENVTIDAVAGVDYFIVVDGFAGSSGAYLLAISEVGTTGCGLTIPVELQGFTVE